MMRLYLRQQFIWSRIFWDINSLSISKLPPHLTSQLPLFHSGQLATLSKHIVTKPNKINLAVPIELVKRHQSFGFSARFCKENCCQNQNEVVARAIQLSSQQPSMSRHYIYNGQLSSMINDMTTFNAKAENTVILMYCSRK